MRACAIVVAAILMFAGVARAEPAKDTGKPVAQQKQALAVELASADAARPSDTRPAKATSEPVKRVTPRVTTCRCGDPRPGPDTQQR